MIYFMPQIMWMNICDTHTHIHTKYEFLLIFPVHIKQYVAAIIMQIPISANLQPVLCINAAIFAKGLHFQKNKQMFDSLLPLVSCLRNKNKKKLKIIYETRGLLDWLLGTKCCNIMLTWCSSASMINICVWVCVCAFLQILSVIATLK